MFQYEYFYRKYGIRQAAQMSAPPLAKLEFLELPKGSILHYLGTDVNEVGPNTNDFLFRHITKPIMVGHIVDIADNKGQPRRLPIQVDPLIRHHHVANRRFRQMRDLEASSRDPFMLVVYSYALLPRLFRYTRSVYTDYYRWLNIQAAVWKNAGTVAQISDRQQFILCSLPKVLPSVPDLRMGSGELTQRIAKIFNNPDSRFLLELWKWLGPDRERSLLNHVPVEKADRINLIFQETGKWFVVNLGLLNKWRAATKAELEKNPDLSTKGMEAAQLQKRFLRLAMILFEVKTVSVDQEVLDEQAQGEPEVEEQAFNDEDVKVVKQGTAVQTSGDTTVVIGSQGRETPLPAEADYANTDSLGADRAEDIVHDEELDRRTDEELAQLEKISLAVHGSDASDQPVVDLHQALEETTLESGVTKLCDRLADQGLLSAAEYKRHLRLAQTYKTLKAPNGQTLDQFSHVPVEELKITESKAIPDIKTVPDKSMLKSSLHDFDRRYIKEVMHRDVASAVLKIQHAGISVTNYEQERVENVMGSFDAFSIRLVPVEGAPSTIKFRLPVVEEDGTFMANGVKYRLRKQNGDLPIRKIAPDRVALTSYYGKIFVGRSTKKVNDYGHWLRTTIMARALDENDNSVVNVHPGNMFDSEFTAPRIYSILAHGFRNFGAKGFELNFDHTKREVLFGTEVLQAYETEGSLVVGLHTNGEVLVVDKHNTFYIGKEGVLRDVGTIEDFLEIDTTAAPKDFAELKVLGQNIPIGIILAHELGLERLINSLKVEYRRVPAGTRTNLQPHEYSLIFDDETLVFSRDDVLPTLILAGFNEYREAIKFYSVYEFDKPEVYLNILESKKIGIRYLRELDLLYQMFIDPITKEILEEMKEPTNFRALLLRSCELLLTDYHPDEIDPAFMRKKGYERFSGAVYAELIKGIRVHRSRLDKARLPIEINPHAVWMAISQDPSKILVSDINPIENLKQMEAVTFGGTGGRSSRSMTKHTRIYHPNDMGTISESTVDSSDVAINTFTSADPQFSSLRGLSKKYEIGVTGATALLSTSALVSPGSDRDDQIRSL